MPQGGSNIKWVRPRFIGILTVPSPSGKGTTNVPSPFGRGLGRGLVEKPNNSGYSNPPLPPRGSRGRYSAPLPEGEGTLLNSFGKKEGFTAKDAKKAQRIQKTTSKPFIVNLLPNPVIPAKAGIQRNRDNPLRLVPRLRGGDG
jgi:hypothetical protein